MIVLVAENLWLEIGLGGSCLCSMCFVGCISISVVTRIRIAFSLLCEVLFWENFVIGNALGQNSRLLIFCL